MIGTGASKPIVGGYNPAQRERIRTRRRAGEAIESGEGLDLRSLSRMAIARASARVVRDHAAGMDARRDRARRGLGGARAADDQELGTAADRDGVLGARSFPDRGCGRADGGACRPATYLADL